ncbi:MAG: hypothetical protein IME96_00910 [Proteobacteria bacterium]|nr:hypothetical protein [Pseudomonadota bacterium]
MKIKYLVAPLILIITIVLLGWLFKERITSDLKARGYLEYTPDEAITLAYDKCSGCHNSAKITNYCFRCGPPFIVVVRNMRTLISLEKGKPGKEGLPAISDNEAVTIVQVWNALIGNWEEGWRKKDLIKMMEGDQALIDLLNTPPSERKIESALFGKTVPGGVVRKESINPELPADK